MASTSPRAPWPNPAGISSASRSTARASATCCWRQPPPELKNLRVIDHDAVEVLRDQIPPDTLDEIQILFPDPWPKTRHHKRRLIQPGFATLAASRLRARGWLRLATDWAPYAEHMQLVLDACPLLARQDAGTPTDSSATRAATRFEQRGLRLGHEVADLAYRRRP